MKLFGRNEEENYDTEEYTEFPYESEEESKKISIEKLQKASDIDKVIRKLRDGDIVFVRIRELKDSNMDELKYAVSRIKTACMNLKADVAGAGEDWLIVAPQGTEILR